MFAKKSPTAESNFSGKDILPITPLSNIGKDAPRISGKNFHGHASTLWLSHKYGHHQTLEQHAKIENKMNT
jgi:hypothetical protein